MLCLLLIVMKSTKSRGCASLPGVFQKRGGEKKSTTKHIRSEAALPNLPRLEFRRSLLIPRSGRCPKEQIQHDDTKA